MMEPVWLTGQTQDPLNTYINSRIVLLHMLNNRKGGMEIPESSLSLQNHFKKTDDRRKAIPYIKTPANKYTRKVQ